MAPQPAASTESKRSERVIISLPKEVGPKLDELRWKIGAAVFELQGVTVEPSRAQLVESMVNDALKPKGNGAA